MNDDDSDYEILVQPDLLPKDQVSLLTSEETSSNPNHWPRQVRIRWTVLLFFGCVLAYSTRTTITISAVHVGKELGWDKKLSGIVLSSFFFGYIMTQVIGGILSDKLGGERMLYLSATVWAIATISIPFITKIAWIPATGTIIGAQVLSGAAQGFHFPAISSLLSKRVAVENRSSVFSFAASGTAVGTIFSGFAGSLLHESHGWRIVFLFNGGLSVLWVLIFRFYVFRDATNNQPKMIAIDKRDSVEWIKLFKIKSFWALLICATCESLVFTNLLSWLPTYFHETFPNGQGWLFNVFPWIACFILENACGILSDKLILIGVSRTKVRKLFVSLALFTAAGLSIILSQVTTFGSALLLMTLIIGFLGCNASGIGMNPQDLAPKHAGYLFGIMNTLGAISGTLGVYLTGHILHESNSWSSVFYMTAITSLIGAVAFVLFGTGRQIM